MKMKRLLALALAGVMTFSMAACGGGSEDKKAEGEQKTVNGDVLDAEQHFNTYLFSEPSTLDSVKGNDNYGNGILLNIMEPLTRMDEEDGKNVRVGAGAESWESNEDGSVWTFKLRENQWSDGKPVTAEDYVYGITRTLDPEAGSPNAYLITCIKNGVAVNNGEKAVSELGIKALDEKTVEITLESPTPYFLSLTDTKAMFPQRKDIVEKYGETYGAEKDNIVGNGPFVLQTWTHNSEIVLAKNEKYWDAENVHLQNVNYKILNDENAIYNSFENKSLDTCNSGTPEWIDRFKSKEDVVYTKSVTPSVRFHFFNTKDELFANENIRKAFTLAINREEVAKSIYFDTMDPLYSWVPDGVSTGEIGIYREQVEEPLKAMYESENPKELLLKGMEELGLGSDPSKLKVKFTLGDTNQWIRNYGEYYQQVFKKELGVNIELDTNEWGTFQSKTNSGDYQMGYMVWGIDYNDPIAMLSLMKSTSKSIPTFWENAEYDALIDQASVEMDEQKRVELYQQAEKILFEEGCALCPVVNESSHSFTYEYVKNTSKLPFTTMGSKKLYISGR